MDLLKVSSYLRYCFSVCNHLSVSLMMSMLIFEMGDFVIVLILEFLQKDFWRNL